MFQHMFMTIVFFFWNHKWYLSNHHKNHSVRFWKIDVNLYIFFSLYISPYPVCPAVVDWSKNTECLHYDQRLDWPGCLLCNFVLWWILLSSSLASSLIIMKVGVRLDTTRSPSPLCLWSNSVEYLIIEIRTKRKPVVCNVEFVSTH